MNKNALGFGNRKDAIRFGMADVGRMWYNVRVFGESAECRYIDEDRKETFNEI